MSCNLTRIITASLIFSQVISAIPRCDSANPCIQATDGSVLSDRYCFTTQAMSAPLLGNFHGVPVLRDTRMQTAQLDRFFENGHIRHRHSEIPDRNGPVSLPTPERNTGGRRRVVGFTEGDGTSDFEGNSSVLHEGSVSPREAERLTRAWFSAGYTRLCLASVPLGKRGLLDNILGQRGVAQLGSRFENGEADVYLEWSAAFAKYVITKVQARTEGHLLNSSNDETYFFKTVYGRDSSGKYSILLDSFYDRSPHHRGSVWASHGYREIQLRPFVLDSHGRFGSLGIPHVANLGSNYADGEARCDFVWSEAMQSYFPTLVHARTKKASTSDEPFKSFPLKLVWSIEEHRNVLIGSIWEDSPRHAGMIWAAKGFRHIRIDSIPVYNDGDFHILGMPYWRYFRRSRGMRTGSAYFSLDGESKSYLFQDAFLSSAKRVSAFDPIKGNWRLVPERHAGAALRWAREHGFEQIKIEALPIRGEEGQIDIPGQGDHVFVGAGYRRGNADLYLSWSESSRKFITTHVSARQEESVSATYLPLRLVYGKSNNGYTDLLDSFLHRSPTHHGRPWMALGYRDIKITSVPLRAHGTFRVINANQERLGDIYAGGLAEVFLALTDSRHPAYRITHVLAQTRNQVLSGETGTVLPFNTVWGCSASGGYDHFIGVFRELSPRHLGQEWNDAGYHDIQIDHVEASADGVFGLLGQNHLADFGKDYAYGTANITFRWSDSLAAYQPLRVHAVDAVGEHPRTVWFTCVTPAGSLERPSWPPTNIRQSKYMGHMRLWWLRQKAPVAEGDIVWTPLWKADRFYMLPWNLSAVLDFPDIQQDEPLYGVYQWRSRQDPILLGVWAGRQWIPAGEVWTRQVSGSDELHRLFEARFKPWLDAKWGRGQTEDAYGAAAGVVFVGMIRGWADETIKIEARKAAREATFLMRSVGSVKLDAVQEEGSIPQDYRKEIKDVHADTARSADHHMAKQSLGAKLSHLFRHDLRFLSALVEYFNLAPWEYGWKDLPSLDEEMVAELSGRAIHIIRQEISKGSGLKPADIMALLHASAEPDEPIEVASRPFNGVSQDTSLNIHEPTATPPNNRNGHRNSQMEARVQPQASIPHSQTISSPKSILWDGVRVPGLPGSGRWEVRDTPNSDSEGGLISLVYADHGYRIARTSPDLKTGRVLFGDDSSASIWNPEFRYYCENIGEIVDSPSITLDGQHMLVRRRPSWDRVRGFTPTEFIVTVFDRDPRTNEFDAHRGRDVLWSNMPIAIEVPVRDAENRITGYTLTHQELHIDGGVIVTPRRDHLLVATGHDLLSIPCNPDTLEVLADKPARRILSIEDTYEGQRIFGWHMKGLQRPALFSNGVDLFMVTSLRDKVAVLGLSRDPVSGDLQRDEKGELRGRIVISDEDPITDKPDDLWDVEGAFSISCRYGTGDQGADELMIVGRRAAPDPDESDVPYTRRVDNVITWSPPFTFALRQRIEPEPDDVLPTDGILAPLPALVPEILPDMILTDVLMAGMDQAFHLDFRSHHLPLYLWRQFDRRLQRAVQENELDGVAYRRIVERGLAWTNRQSGQIFIAEKALPFLVEVLNKARGSDRPKLTISDVARYLRFHESLHRSLIHHPEIIDGLLSQLRHLSYPTTGISSFEILQKAFAANYGREYQHDERRFAEELWVVYWTERYLLNQPVRLLDTAQDRRAGRTDLPDFIQTAFTRVSWDSLTEHLSPGSPIWCTGLQQWGKLRRQLADQVSLEIDGKVRAFSTSVARFEQGAAKSILEEADRFSRNPRDFERRMIATQRENRAQRQSLYRGPVIGIKEARNLYARREQLTTDDLHTIANVIQKGAISQGALDWLILAVQRPWQTLTISEQADLVARIRDAARRGMLPEDRLASLLRPIFSAIPVDAEPRDVLLRSPLAQSWYATRPVATKLAWLRATVRKLNGDQYQCVPLAEVAAEWGISTETLIRFFSQNNIDPITLSIRPRRMTVSTLRAICFSIRESPHDVLLAEDILSPLDRDRIRWRAGESQLEIPSTVLAREFGIFTRTNRTSTFDERVRWARLFLTEQIIPETETPDSLRRAMKLAYIPRSLLPLQDSAANRIRPVTPSAALRGIKTIAELREAIAEGSVTRMIYEFTTLELQRELILELQRQTQKPLLWLQEQDYTTKRLDRLSEVRNGNVFYLHGLYDYLAKQLGVSTQYTPLRILRHLGLVEVPAAIDHPFQLLASKEELRSILESEWLSDIPWRYFNLPLFRELVLELAGQPGVHGSPVARHYEQVELPSMTFYDSGGSRHALRLRGFYAAFYNDPGRRGVPTPRYIIDRLWPGLETVPVDLEFAARATKAAS